MPDIIFVDNDPEGFLALASKIDRERIRPYSIDGANDMDAAFSAAHDAALWLFDFFLDDESEESHPENGLSLFQRWRGAIPTGRPATAVVSGHLQKALGEPIGPPARYHVHAQLLGVEWIGEKNEESMRKIIKLADASSRLAGRLSPQSGAPEHKIEPLSLEDLCSRLLEAPDGDWINSARRQVDRARPPRILAPLAGVGAARFVLAWLLNHVLPYPSFLLSDLQAAVRLGISIESLQLLLQQQNGLSETLSKIVYTGPLADFDQRRWWRAGIDNLAWRMSQQDEGYNLALESNARPTSIQWLAQTEPVVVSDPDLVETTEVAEAAECVRAMDEDFPPNVDPAWVRIKDAREDHKLRAKIVFEDRILLDLEK